MPTRSIPEIAGPDKNTKTPAFKMPVGAIDTHCHIFGPAPAGMAPELVAKINADLLTALKDPAVLAEFDKLGAVPVGSSPQDFEAFMRAEAAKWGSVLKRANVRIE